MSNLESNPDFVSVDTAAVSLSVSTKTIRNWIKSGMLPAYETGPKLIRISVLDLRAFCKPARQVNWTPIGDDRSNLMQSARMRLTGQNAESQAGSSHDLAVFEIANGGHNDLG